ncbi:MAG: 50S ribosomal protein L23 [Clostridiales bacterium]|jgi:large subunit ribosomal protein L23|nr:50S ribosomal protein L23 [Clostridiales bacterium]
MADLKYYDVIFKPIMTEKSMAMMEGKRYAFYVHPEATKTQVKEAVEKMFDGAKVAAVNTIKAHPKKRQRRGFLAGQTTVKKKAIVTLTPGSKEIEIFEGI